MRKSHSHWGIWSKMILLGLLQYGKKGKGRNDICVREEFSLVTFNGQKANKPLFCHSN